MSQTALLTAANAVAQLTRPLIQASVLPQNGGPGQTQAPTSPSTKTTDTVSISLKAATLQGQKP